MLDTNPSTNPEFQRVLKEKVNKLPTKDIHVILAFIAGEVKKFSQLSLSDQEVYLANQSPEEIQNRNTIQRYAKNTHSFFTRVPGMFESAENEMTVDTIIDFLNDLMGPEIVFTRGFYQKSLSGCPGISLHTDGQPHGSNLFGYEGTCPRLLRVLYYLDDITPERAPFRLIPRSHISFHADASPYTRYKWHPEEITIVVPAGSAVIVPSMMIHGSHPNLDESSRELLQFGYRPAWAGPIKNVEEWDENLVSNAPASAKPYLRSLNTTGFEWEQEHKPKGMKTEAPGINPSRWDNN